MPIFTLEVPEPVMRTIRRVAQDEDISEVDALKQIISAGLARAEAEHKYQDCPEPDSALDRSRSGMDAIVEEEAPAEALERGGV